MMLAAAWADPAAAQPRTRRPAWKPRLMVTAGGSVWSPGSEDKERFLASFGGSLTAIYWARWNTQLALSLGYSPLNTDQFYWKPEALQDTTVDVWEVEGSLWTVSAEIRQMFPTDQVNYLYLGAGVDFYYFGDVEGRWEAYGTAQPLQGNIVAQRDPSQAFGLHASPGLFFLFHPRVPVDIALRLHLLYDGEETAFWLQPTFNLGYRIF
ncbi:MAG: hypothetical protein C4524_08055 [Candidatus Zixiibacteriota bacterium]|nr:MAG: hypothetical protein C4524_08055 [candidate division Zixibacteria bacterium]